MKRLFIILMLLSLAMVGCAARQNIYVDGMPINDHEYSASTPEGIRTSFILTRYYEKKFDDESMLYPEYLDIWDAENKINIENTVDLLLHIKVVNIKRIPITVWGSIKSSNENVSLVLYRGKLPRKDLALQLPIAHKGQYKFEVVIVGNKEELFSVWGEYQNERGER